MAVTGNQNYFNSRKKKQKKDKARTLCITQLP